MTLPEFGDKMVMEAHEKPLSIGEAVREVMLRSHEEGRLTCGVYECAKLLEIEPEGIMVCILPAVATEDISVRIQHTLVEAYCRENNIKVLKVDSAEKLRSLLVHQKLNNNKHNSNNNNNNNNNDNSSKKGEESSVDRATSVTMDFRCVLVKSPQVLSEEDDFLSGYCDSLSLCDGVYPVIQIPT